MNPTIKFAILTFPRTGSTTLTRAINLHPEIQCIREPFRPQNQPVSPYLKKAESFSAFQDALEDLYRDQNGLQHKFQDLLSSWNEHILVHPEIRLVLLWRRNRLKKVVSMMISRKTGSWDNDRNALMNFEFGKFEIPRLLRMLDRYKFELEYYRNRIRESGKPCLEIAYEDLYKGDNPAPLVESLFSHIGLDPEIPESIREAVLKLLSVSNKKNDRETYLRIPNIREIERALGSEENGFLFD